MTHRAIMSVPVSTDGIKLPPMHIFTGSQMGQIVNKKSPNFLTSYKYYCQKNVLIDEGAIIE